MPSRVLPGIVVTAPTTDERPPSPVDDSPVEGPQDVVEIVQGPVALDASPSASGASKRSGPSAAQGDDRLYAETNLAINLKGPLTPDQLQKYFQRFGNVKEVVIKDPKDGQSNLYGYGIVKFENPCVSRILMFNTVHEVEGVQVDVRRANQRGVDYMGITRKLFIGGVSKSTDEEGLKTYLRDFGEVEHIRLCRDSGVEEHKGFGFVTFSNSAPVNKLVEIKYHMLNGRMMEFRKALPREFAHQNPVYRNLRFPRHPFSRRSFSETAMRNQQPRNSTHAQGQGNGPRHRVNNLEHYNMLINSLQDDGVQPGSPTGPIQMHAPTPNAWNQAVIPPGFGGGYFLQNNCSFTQFQPIQPRPQIPNMYYYPPQFMPPPVQGPYNMNVPSPPQMAIERQFGFGPQPMFFPYPPPIFNPFPPQPPAHLFDACQPNMDMAMNMDIDVNTNMVHNEQSPEQS